MNLSPMQSRLLAVSLLVAVLVVVALGAVQPAWRRYQAMQETIESHEQSIAKFRSIAASREAYERALRQFQTRDDVARVLLGERSVSLAGASLQQRIKGIVESSQGSLVSAQALDPQEEGPFTRVSVNVRMQLSVEALQAVLHRLEVGTPYVVIDQVVVIARNARVARRLARRRGRVPEQTLDVRMTVSGFMAEPAPARDAAPA
ncbi:MAG: type II secretion system protein M [Gammaproteobacteria bacterium]|nr:type II secretion system protein M [Gammaproteobacteria bacterium]